MEIRVKKKKSAKPSLHVAVVAFGLKGLKGAMSRGLGFWVLFLLG